MASDVRPHNLSRMEVSFVCKTYVQELYLSEPGESSGRLPRLQISVRHAFLVEKFPRSYYVYIIEVDTPWGYWTAQRRYSQFHRLHQNVQNVLRAGEHLAVLPGKKFTLAASEELAQARIRGLHAYLLSLIVTAALNSETLWEFLGVQPFTSHFLPDHPVPMSSATAAHIAGEFLFGSSRSMAMCLIEYAASQLRAVASAASEDTNSRRPLPSLRELLVILVHAGDMSLTTFALVLLNARSIQRLRGPHSIQGSPHLLAISLFIITTKFWNDAPEATVVNYWFEPSRVCAMELSCLSALGFVLNVDPGEYEQFVLRLDRTIRKEFEGGHEAQQDFDSRQQRAWARSRIPSERLSAWVFLGQPA